MNCPYCNKSIEAITGFQEVKKFQDHLPKCKKNPNRVVKTLVDEYGQLKEINCTTSSLKEALNIRAESGQ
jgi:hypothetical protein